VEACVGLVAGRGVRIGNTPKAPRCPTFLKKTILNTQFYYLHNILMNKFLVLFLAPASVMDAWMKTSPEVRESEEKKMRAEWDAWMSTHAGMIKETNAGGKTKRVTSGGVVDARNDIMLYLGHRGRVSRSRGKSLHRASTPWDS